MTVGKGRREDSLGGGSGVCIQCCLIKENLDAWGWFRLLCSFTHWFSQPVLKEGLQWTGMVLGTLNTAANKTNSFLYSQTWLPNSETTDNKHIFFWVSQLSRPWRSITSTRKGLRSRWVVLFYQDRLEKVFLSLKMRHSCGLYCLSPTARFLECGNRDPQVSVCKPEPHQETLSSLHRTQDFRFPEVRASWPLFWIRP